MNLPAVLFKLCIFKNSDWSYIFYIFKFIPRLAHPHLGHPYTDIANDHYKLVWCTLHLSLLGLLLGHYHWSGSNKSMGTNLSVCIYLFCFSNNNTPSCKLIYINIRDLHPLYLKFIIIWYFIIYIFWVIFFIILVFKYC